MVFSLDAHLTPLFVLFHFFWAVWWKTSSHLHPCNPCFGSVFQRYNQLYDLSRSERSKIRELAVTMATDGQPLERIGELLHVAVGPLHLSVNMVLHDAVEKITAALRYYFLYILSGYIYSNCTLEVLKGVQSTLVSVRKPWSQIHELISLARIIIQLSTLTSCAATGQLPFNDKDITWT